MYLNHDAPTFKCLVNKAYLINGSIGIESNFTEFIEVMVLGFTSRPHRALGFNVLLQDGTLFWQLPIEAFCSLSTNLIETKLYPTSDLQFWDCFSYNFTVHQYSYLRDVEMRIMAKNNEIWKARYMFTLDWAQDEKHNLCEMSDEHKCLHMMETEQGLYCLYPNNRIQCLESSFVSRPFKDWPKDYRAQSKIYYAENNFRVTDEYFYAKVEL